MTRARASAGFTLIELLLVMTMSLLLLGATLMIFERVHRESRDTGKRSDTAEIARNALDVQARQLRNLAQRLNNNEVIARVEAFDFIFQTSDPSRTWVRYCLDTGTGGGTPQAGRLWASSLAVANAGANTPVSAGMGGACPGTGWSQQRIVAESVTNRIGGVDRPVFSYSCLDGGTGCLGSQATYDQIVNVGSTLLVDTSPLKGPKELKVATGVYLRNQNQAPIAEFDVTPLPTPARTVMLNASQSSDYEGRTLSYFWFKNTMPTAIRCNQPQSSGSGASKTLWGGALIGEGVTLSHTFPTGDGGGATIALVVCDPGDRYDMTDPRTVTIP